MSNKDRASTKEMTGWKLKKLKELQKAFPGYPNDYLRDMIPKTRSPASPKADPPPVQGATPGIIKSLKHRVKKLENQISKITSFLRRRGGWV